MQGTLLPSSHFGLELTIRTKTCPCVSHMRALPPLITPPSVVKILEVASPENEGHEVAVIGTLYKDMKLKPSILDEYTKVWVHHVEKNPGGDFLG